MAGTVRPNLGLTTGYSYLEDNWHTGMESNLRALDALVHLTVEDQDLTAPPVANDGQMYIIGPSATGDWLNHDRKVAVWEAGLNAWRILTPKAGWRAFVKDEGVHLIYNSTAARWKPDAYVNVHNFASFQAAHDALPATGGVIFIPQPSTLGGGYTNYNHASTPAFAGSGSTPALTITKPCVLLGPGRDLCSLRDFGTGAANRDAIYVNRAGGVIIKGLALNGAGTAGTGNLVNWFVASTNLAELTIQDVSLLDAPAWAFKAVPTAGFYASELVLDHVQFGSSQFGGAMGGSGGSGSGDVLLGAGSGGTNNVHFLRCDFIGPGYGTHGGLAKGAVHFHQVAIARFIDCSFQGNDDCAAFSLEGTGAAGSHSITFRDCYIERANTANTPVHAITLSGDVDGLTLDSFYFTQGEASTGPKLLRTANSTTQVGHCYANGVILIAQNPLSGTDTIQLGTGTQQIILDNVHEYSTVTGATRDVYVTGSTLPTVASISTMTLPNAGSPTIQVTGTTTINTITPSWAGRVVTLVFAASVTVNDNASGGNLKLAGSANFNASADDTLTLVSDGTSWLEIARAAN